MRMPASGIRVKFPVPMNPWILLLALFIAPVAPASADAGVSKRIKLLTTHIDQSPEDQALRLQRALAYVDDNEPELALADIKVAQTLGYRAPVRFALQGWRRCKNRSHADHLAGAAGTGRDSRV